MPFSSLTLGFFFPPLVLFRLSSLFTLITLAHAFQTCQQGSLIL